MVPPAIATILAVASAASAVIGGFSALQAGKDQRRQAQQQAEYQRQIAAEKARRQRRQSKRMQGRLAAMVAASGVEMEGSPLLLAEDSAREAELEYQQILHAGNMESSSLLSRGDAAYASGVAGLVKGVGQAGSTILGSIDTAPANPMQTKFDSGETVFWTGPRQLPNTGG